MTSGWVWPAVAAVAVRPGLWGVALRQGLRLAVPDYLRFRRQTAFGDPAKAPAPADVIAYLEWCRRFPSH